MTEPGVSGTDLATLLLHAPNPIRVRIGGDGVRALLSTNRELRRTAGQQLVDSLRIRASQIDDPAAHARSLAACSLRPLRLMLTLETENRSSSATRQGEQGAAKWLKGAGAAGCWANVEECTIYYGDAVGPLVRVRRQMRHMMFELACIF